MLILLTFVIGIVSGLRAFTAPAAVSWGAVLLAFSVPGSWLAFMASKWTAWVFTGLALFELFSDKRASTPSRKVPVQFSARILTGALAGATLGAAQNSVVAGCITAVIGSISGTYAGAWARRKMALIYGADMPAAVIEDVACLLLAGLTVCGAQLL
jgi:uncharacterized membrane protein